MTKATKAQTDKSKPLRICLGETTKTNRVTNASPTWEQLCKKFETPIRTPETYDEYCSMDTDTAGRIKDVGYFIGGPSANGQRNAKNITTRNLITLDLDHAPNDLKEKFERSVGQLEFCIYSTHKHSPENPRFRMLLPLSRTVSGTEYKAVARKLAQKIGIEYCDEASYVVSQVMYWPSCSKDAEYIFYVNEGEWVDPDKILALYKDWQDASEWPVSSREKNAPRAAIKKAGNPLKNPASSVVGVAPTVSMMLSQNSSPMCMSQQMTLIDTHILLEQQTEERLFMTTDSFYIPTMRRMRSAERL